MVPCVPLPFLKEVLPWIASLRGWIFGPAPRPIWLGCGGKAEWWPHNDQCLRGWLIFHVQTGGWLLGPDKCKVCQFPPGVIKHGKLWLLHTIFTRTMCMVWQWQIYQSTLNYFPNTFLIDNKMHYDIYVYIYRYTHSTSLLLYLLQVWRHNCLFHSVVLAQQIVCKSCIDSYRVGSQSRMAQKMVKQHILVLHET